jgi:hypothetical protein
MRTPSRRELLAALFGFVLAASLTFFSRADMPLLPQVVQRLGTRATCAALVADSPSPLFVYGRSERLLTARSSAARLYTAAAHAPLAPLDVDPALLAPLSHEARSAIVRNQMRSDSECSRAAFLIVANINPQNHGIGSTMHVLGFYLGVALEMRRVFAFDGSAGAAWFDAAECPPGAANWECVLAAPTNCSRAHHTLENTLRIDERALGYRYDALGYPSSHVPRALRSALCAHNPSMGDNEAKYWWRAQSAAYLLRWNDETVAAIAALRSDAARFDSRGEPGHVDARAASLVPLPPGVVHAHIRHGDKGAEMPLVPTAAYVRAAEALFSVQSLMLRRVLLMTTDDPSAVGDATAAGRETGWTVLSTVMARVSDASRPVDQLSATSRESGKLRVMHLLLLQLSLALEADAWVHTLSSNWNRLVDELRCVWVGKCGLPAVELGAPGVRERLDW